MSVNDFITALLGIAEDIVLDEGKQTKTTKTTGNDTAADTTAATAAATAATAAAATAAAADTAAAQGEEGDADADLLAEPTKMPLTSWYLNDRAKFIEATNKIFESFSTSHPKTTPAERFELQEHQHLVQDYMALYTPYRGLLVYHGLGSGKTCTSIAIAEGIKTKQQVIVMTPAALKLNYQAELKKCGSHYYKSNHYWTRVTKAELQQMGAQPAGNLAEVMFRTKKDTVWVIKNGKPSNYGSLSLQHQTEISNQIDALIDTKYTFLSHNGGQSFAKRQQELLDAIPTTQKNRNPYSNRVVIIDEIHLVISAIVNKLNGNMKKEDKAKSASLNLYKYLCTATNCKIVFLSGTPITNDPVETAVLYNMLRGSIVTYNYKLATTNNSTVLNQVQDTFFIDLFHKQVKGQDNIIDYVAYSNKDQMLTITRNPFHFVNTYSQQNKYTGVQYRQNEAVDLTALVKDVLKTKGIVAEPPQLRSYTALPDKRDEFAKIFIDATGAIKKAGLFKKRILGLTSYFTSQEKLMPTLKALQLVPIEMSDTQFGAYAEKRQLELIGEEKEKTKRQLAKHAPKTGKDKDSHHAVLKSSYRVDTRQLCNFVFPTTDKEKEQPEADKDKAGQDVGVNDKDELELDEEDKNEQQEEKKVENQAKVKYLQLSQPENARRYLAADSLPKYSAKYDTIMKTILQEKNLLHLVYTFFIYSGSRIFKLILEQNNYVQLRLKKQNNTWVVDLNGMDRTKYIATPKFILHDGDTDADERNALLDIFNGHWEKYPSVCQTFDVDHRLFIGVDSAAADKLTTFRQRCAADGGFGNINVCIISKTGSDGISLKNVRMVHLTEPHWHLVRLEQVIGRARRINSHQDFASPADRYVKVRLYLSVITKPQLDHFQKLANDGDDPKLEPSDDKTGYFIALAVQKVSAQTTDVALYNIGRRKYARNLFFLKAMQQSAIDCVHHNRSIGCFQLADNEQRNPVFKPDTPTVDNTLAEGDVEIQLKQKVQVQETRKKISFRDATTNEKVTLFVIGNQIYDQEKNGTLVTGKLLETAQKRLAKSKQKADAAAAAAMTPE